MPTEDDEEAFMESLSSQFKFGEEEKAYLRSMRDNPPSEEELGLNDFEDASAGKIYDDEDTRDITTQTDRLDALITKLKSISEAEGLSDDERRTQIRQLLFDPIEGAKGINRGIKSGETLKLSSGEGVARAMPSLLPPASETRIETLSPTFPLENRKARRRNLETSLDLDDFLPAARVHINTLQNALFEAAKKPEGRGRHAAGLRKTIWSSYLMCRSTLLSRPENVPLRIWSGIWNVLLIADPSEYYDRMAHLKYLGDDICKVGIRMDTTQKLLYIEALLAQGEIEIAAHYWENLEEQVKMTDHMKQWWKLGVNIFCHRGRIDRALHMASLILRDTQDIDDYRVLLPIIQACFVSPHKYGAHMAWALYIRLKVYVGPQMVMNDYDIITLTFLEAKRPDLALGAFKDMMLPPNMMSGHDSTMLYRALATTEGPLESLTISEKELALQNLPALVSLPREFKNKYFFGSWLKKLIGEGQLVAAKKVLDFTSEIGICPDARHMNGLIGALFREGTEKSDTLAKEMAWDMINARLAFVKLRDMENTLEGPVRPIAAKMDMLSGTGVARTLSQKLIPNATIETFCILISQYRRLQKHEILLQLFDTLREAKIPPNAQFMNDLLAMDSKAHKRQWAWNTYLSMTKAGSVRPNYQTFSLLYSLAHQSLDPVYQGRALAQNRFASPQKLFGEMMKHKESLDRDGAIPRELYDAIILSFSYAQDQPGTAVALRALQKHFGALPNEQTARSIILQLARLGQTNQKTPKGIRNRRFNIRSQETKERISQVSRILQKLTHDRAEALEQQGIAVEELSEEEKLEEALLVLSELLRHAFQSMTADENRQIYTASGLAKAAAEVMGVPDCVPWEERDDEMV
ncbi:hypothetical protein LSUE1_G006205 [Lachnellula suecica]|uniref:Pentatricopeptide repeat-containing protein n=1 Tax=Lachnellula suecica TaxID=602035 RepID=A0A8T9BYC4_9HELO|nr:hypothetical protein LSUE1_G006205 [Lachnellula suecica]